MTHDLTRREALKGTADAAKDVHFPPLPESS